MVERSATLEVAEQVDEAAQVDRVLGQAAGAVRAHRRGERAGLGEARVDERLPRLDEARALRHPVDGEHPGGELAQSEGGEAAAADLGEHREPLLGLVVASESGAEHLDRLRGPVDLGDEVGADLVLEQRVGACPLHSGVGVDEERVARDHDAVDVVPDLRMHPDVLVDRGVEVDLGLGEGEELLGGDLLPLRLGGGDLLDDPLCLRPQLGGSTPVELDAQVTEVLAVAGHEHVELEGQLAVLVAQQRGDRGVGDRPDVDVRDDLLEDLGVGLDVAVAERRLPDLALEELCLDVVGVHRCDVEEEAHRARHLGQRVVDGEVRDRHLAQRRGVLAHHSLPRPVSRSTAARTGS